MMADDLIGLIPAAGKGVRLGLPYPKELYPIIKDNRYKPVAQYVLENLVTSGVRHIVFVINETKHQLIGYFGDGHRFGCNISYVVQEQRNSENASTSPGLADALNSAYHLIQGKTVCFGMADTIIAPKDAFRQVLDRSQPGDDVALGLFETRTPEKFGMVQLDAANRVACIVDKPAQTELKLMWGFLVWKALFSEHLHQCVMDKGVGDFAQVMNLAIQSGFKFKGVVIEEGDYSDLGTYSEILELERKYRAF
jgi:glucose-1-phosphate thymidylyltransferase